ALWAEGGRVEEAIALASEALAGADHVGDPLLRLNAQINLARALRTTDPKRAEKILRDAAASTDPRGPATAELYDELTNLLADSGFAEEALKYSRKAHDAERK